MNVIAAVSRRKEITYMKTFTIDADNNISVFATQEAATAEILTPFQTFGSQKDLAKLAATWPTERLVAIWNGIPGVTPIKKFKDRQTGVSRIWKAIQSLVPTESRATKPATK